MTGRRRGPGLFWTIAAMFSLAVVIGTVVQVLVTLAILRPIEEREAQTHVEMVARSLAAEIAAAPRALTAAELDSLLASHRASLGSHPAWIVYREQDGRVVGASAGQDQALARETAARITPDRSPQGPPVSTSSDGPRLLARRPVRRGSDLLGEVLVVQPPWPQGDLNPFGPRTSFYFLPISLMFSAVFALLTVRLLVRRLRSLGRLATRVADGDFAVRIGDPSGDEIGQLAGQLDRMTERLADARTRIEESVRQRRQLLADITHEIATPLTSIRGYAETLLDPDVPLSAERQAEYLRGVAAEARRLDRLIQDLFDLARLEAGASPLSREPLNWTALCVNTADRFRPRFKDAGLLLRWRECLPEAWIEADGHRMEQVIENLLVNALRYVSAGDAVELSLVHAPGAPDRYRLSVTDNGPGVPAGELPRLFQRFYRGSGVRGASGTPGHGSGLGLAIVHDIVERHGGTARAEACAPSGLSITIEMPAVAEPAPFPCVHKAPALT